MPTTFILVITAIALHLAGRELLTRRIEKRRGYKQQKPVWSRWLLEWAAYLATFALIAATLLTRAPLGDLAMGGPVRFIGVVLLYGAVALQLKAKWDLGDNWGNASHGAEAHDRPITTRGLYRLTRNPMYAGTLALFLAFVLILQNTAALGLFVLVFLYVRFITIPSEEKLLREKHGEAYFVYMKRVPRLAGPRTITLLISRED